MRRIGEAQHGERGGRQNEAFHGYRPLEIFDLRGLDYGDLSRASPFSLVEINTNSKAPQSGIAPLAPNRGAPPRRLNVRR
jgi:hypothetical protein